MMTNRAIIYVFYSHNGRMYDWYINLFKEFERYSEYFVCIVNGNIEDRGKQIINEYADHIIYRENKGYDISAYRDGIFYILSKNKKYKEVILCNNSFFGPIYSFDKMFLDMQERNCDFWGITAFNETLSTPYHIQSYFIGIRSKMFESNDLKTFLINLGKINHYQDAVDKFEKKFTAYFHEIGYKSDVYIDTRSIKGNALTRYSKELLIKGCPILKRRNLVYSKTYGFNYGVNNSGLLNYISKYTDYNVDYIYEDILNEFSYDQIDFCLDTNVVILETSNQENIENQALMIVKYDKGYESYIKNILEQTNVNMKNVLYVENTSFSSVLKNIKNNQQFDFFVVLSLSCYPYLNEIQNESIIRHKVSCILFSMDYFRNSLQYLRNNNKLGLLVPVDNILGIKARLWSKNIPDKALDCIKQKGIHVPASKHIDYLGLSSSFIIKKDALHLLFAHEFDLQFLEHERLFDIYGGKFIRYITQAYGYYTKKIASCLEMGKSLSLYSYKYNEFNMEDIVKSYIRGKIRF